jgi:hypothetical protein
MALSPKDQKDLEQKIRNAGILALGIAFAIGFTLGNFTSVLLRSL